LRRPVEQRVELRVRQSLVVNEQRDLGRVALDQCGHGPIEHTCGELRGRGSRGGHRRTAFRATLGVRFLRCSTVKARRPDVWRVATAWRWARIAQRMAFIWPLAMGGSEPTIGEAWPGLILL
jgi:hypothetical protein